MSEKEIWRDIPDYEGFYQASNIGRIKNLSRTVKHPSGGNKVIKERILSLSIESSGYFTVRLSKNGNKKTFTVHQLVAMAFLKHRRNGSKIVVDHIDNSPLNNRLDNLQLISNRENLSKDKKGCSSKYVGVCWNKRDEKWQSQIWINGKIKYLGYFDSELEAHQTYQDKLKTL